MNFEITHKAVMACLQTEIPVKLESDPGTGKTNYARALARAANRHFELVLPALCDPTDIGGIPYNHNGKMLVSTPWFVQRCIDAEAASLVLWDEVTNASRSVQGAMLSGLQTGNYGSGRLPEGTWQMLACNPPETAADGIDLSAPFSNRVFHFDWKPSVTEWVGGMLTGFPVPEFLKVGDNWRDGIAKWQSLIASYLRANAGVAYVLPEEEAKRSGPWPSYRSWDMLVCSGLAAADSMLSMQANRDIQLAIASAAVGGTYAVGFFTWMDSLNLPDPETLLANPESFVADPVRGDINFVALASVAQAVCESPNLNRYLSGWKVMEKAARLGLVAEASTAVRSIAQLKKKRPDLDLPIPSSKVLAPFSDLLSKAGLLDMKE